MTEQNQDIKEQLLPNQINDDIYWELKPENEDEIQNQQQQQEQILDYPKINEEIPKHHQGYGFECIFQCIGACLACFCIEVCVRGLC